MAISQSNVWRVLSIRPCSPPSRSSRSNGHGKIAAAATTAQVRLAVRTRTRDGRELAGLEIALDALVDVVLGGTRVGPAQLPRAQPAQLEDLEHVDEVGGRRERDHEAGGDR